MSKANKYGAATLAVSSLAFSIMSHAQGGFEIEEVVVTAAKRTQTLQQIPIAVSVTSADTIKMAKIQDIKDLQSLVPSLRVSQLQNSTNTNFVIRGFGNGANNPGIEPSVGVFIDGVYRSRSASSISDLPNLERVEVLRGPQSTLFGKNASAGVISVVTAKPSGESRGQVSATVGNYGTVILKGQAEGALSDNVAFDISGSHNTSDGYFDNLNTGATLNNRDRQSIRGQLVISPSDNAEVRIIADYDTIDEECCGVVNLVEGALGAFAIPFSGGQIVPNDPEALESYYNLDPSNKIDNSGISMQVDIDYDKFALTSITSFRTTDSWSTIDSDFTSSDIITNPITTDIETFTQEVRLTSTDGDALDWMVGGFFFDETIDYENDLPFGSNYRNYLDALTLALGAPNAIAGIEQALGLPVFATFGQEGQGVTEQATLDNQALSIFGQLDWHPSDRLTATLGFNYTQDEKEATLEQIRGDAFSAIDFVQLGGGIIFQQLVGAGVPAEIAAAQAAALSSTEANPLLGLQALQFLPPLVDYPNAVEDGKSDDSELTYTLRLAYDVNENISIYGGISTGFKASSWNLSRDARPTVGDIDAVRAAGLGVSNLVSGTRLATPEEAEVIEFGLKASFPRGSFNLAIFDQEIAGFQSNIFGGSGFNLANAGLQSTQGVEFDLVYYPTDSLQLGLAGTFLDPVYDDFQGATGVNGPTDLSGQEPAGIHKTSLSASATYRFTVGEFDAFVRGDFQYDDKIPTNDNLLESISSREVKNLNLSAGITSEDGLSLSVWGRNVTDHVTLITGFPSVAQAGSFSGYRTAPRTYGLTLAKDF
jgi:outer membrane receptor protein involved in Fe transport